MYTLTKVSTLYWGVKYNISAMAGNDSYEKIMNIDVYKIRYFIF